MGTITETGDPSGGYGQYSLRFSRRAGHGMAEGHIAKGTFCLGHMLIPMMSREYREAAYLLTVSSADDPDHCIEIVLNEEDFTRAFQQARMDRIEWQGGEVVPTHISDFPDKRPE